MSLAKKILLSQSLLVCVLLSSPGVSFALEGVLDLSVIDASTGSEIPARIRITDNSGKDHTPEKAVIVPIAKDRWFACPGRARLQMPVGKASIRIERGTEYRPIIQTIEIKASKTLRHKVKLERWIDMHRHGYTSGENHLHVPADTLPAMLAAEDLDFGTSLSWWNGPKFKFASERGCLQNLKAGGDVIGCSLCDAEVEHSWGAVYLIGLQKSVNIQSNGQRSNLPFVKFARDNNALISYQGGWSREVLIDALLGYVDVVNLCNNNFHRYKYQPRKRYSNLLNVEGFPDYPNTPQGMTQMNFETYYRLLNCGLRLAAGAGSATGAKTTPVGYNRAYVRAGSDPTLAQFIEAWRKGRNFVTNGPMIFLNANEDRRPGDTIALPEKGGALSLRVTAHSEQPLQSLELIANGKVVGKANIAPGRHEAELSLTLPVEEGAWIAARCTEEDRFFSDDQLNRYNKPGSLPENPCRLRFAHTSPIYITVAGKAAAVSSSIEDARQMLEAFERFARKTASSEYLPEILEAIPKNIEPPQN